VYKFLLPDIGEGVVEAEVLDWKVQVGDRVEEDQVLVELMTDKAEIEIPSPRAGRVHRLHYRNGEVVPVGAVLIEIDDESPGEGRTAPAPAEPRPPAPREASVPRAPAAPPAARATRAEKSAAPPPQPVAHPPEQPARPHSDQKATAPPRAAGPAVRAVPSVRALARRLGVDLAGVQGTGPLGRIMKRDVERRHAELSERAVPEARAERTEKDEPDWVREPLRGVRRTIARRMQRARRTAAHFTYVEELDLTDLLARIGKSDLSSVSPLAFIAHAVVRTLPEFPLLNASIDDEREEIVRKGKVHLGIAVATDSGLLVPVIRDAARLSVAGLAQAIEALARGAREGGLAPADLRGSTFTITSLGRLGGVASTPIVNHPEVAILGVNRIREEPRYVEGSLAARRLMNVSLSVDHRIADGLVAARFVQALRDVLEGARFAELGDGREQS
jgi:pyruvate/2-oxoglutarate dehydrogenase complex dihydrolipoamide acyltransferase (E2) component